MDDYPVLLSAMAICLFGVMSPGPSFVAITNKALTSEREQVLWLTFGIALVNALWAILAMFGLKALMLQLPWLLLLIRVFGAVYLIWFGLRLLRMPSTSFEPSSKGGATKNASRRTSFGEGLLANFSNPKSLLFYSSVFSVAVPESATQSLLIALVFVVFTISIAWYGSLAVVLTTSRIRRLYLNAQNVIQKTCGGLLIIFGGRQLF